MYKCHGQVRGFFATDTSDRGRKNYTAHLLTSVTAMNTRWENLGEMVSTTER